MKKMPKILVTALPLLLILGTALFAEGAPGPLEKASRGIVNIVSGPVEFLREIATGSQDNWYVPGIALGIVKGLGKFATRSFIGVYEVATFPFPFPKGYGPIIEDTDVW